MNQWTALAPLSTDFAAERTQVHYAAWILGSIAHGVLEHEADDSHTNLAFDGERGVFATRALRAGSDLLLELDVARLTLAFCDDGVARAELALAGRQLAEALDWCTAFVRQTRGLDRVLELREYSDFPDAPLAHGAAFQNGDVAARAELSCWFANGQLALNELATRERPMSPIRTWPHHFDMGALIASGPDKLIGLGLSPGDEEHGEPYFYVAAYPSPPVDSLAPLAGPGAWTIRGFNGALLTASEILASSDQAETTAAYLSEAVARCRAILR